MNRTKAHTWAAAALLCFVVAGCSGSIFNLDPMVDSKTDAGGKVILLDTPRNWNHWREMTDRSISDEAEGRLPPGAPPWNQSWSRVICSLRAGTENAERYVQYLIATRQAARLPPIEQTPCPKQKEEPRAPKQERPKSPYFMTPIPGKRGRIYFGFARESRRSPCTLRVRHRRTALPRCLRPESRPVPTRGGHSRHRLGASVVPGAFAVPQVARRRSDAWGG